MDCRKYWVPPIISVTGKATNFKFGRSIHRVHPNKKVHKNFGERGAWAYLRTVKIFTYPYYLRNG